MEDYKEKTLERLEILAIDEVNNKLNFGIALELIEHSFKDENGSDSKENQWKYRVSPEQLNDVLERETLLSEKINYSDLNKEEVENIVKTIFEEVKYNPKLIPYFYPKEVTKDNLKEVQDALENFDIEDWLKEGISYTKESALIPFIQMEYLIKLISHIKLLKLDRDDETLTSMEEGVIEAKFTCEEIIEFDFYKQFPNEKLGQHYFDTSSKDGDRYFLYKLNTDEENISLCVVTNAKEEWKYFFIPKK